MTRDEAIERAAQLAADGLTQKAIARQVTDEGYQVSQSQVCYWLTSKGASRVGSGTRIPEHVAQAICKYHAMGYSYREIEEAVERETGRRVGKSSIKAYRSGPIAKATPERRGQTGRVRCLIVTDDPRKLAYSPDGRVSVKRTPVRLSCGRYGYRLHSSKTGAMYFKYATDFDFLKGLRASLGRFEIIDQRQAA